MDKKAEKRISARRVFAWLKTQPVFVVSFIAAVISMLFVPPSSAYFGYINWHTILCLFAMLAVLNGLRLVGAFRILARALVARFKSVRRVVLALVFVTFFCSMFMTNDMALLTFLPLSAIVLISCKQEKLVLFTFVMQTIAANLGGMLLPFGNPQNLFLFSYFEIGFSDFIATMALPVVVSGILLLACCFLRTNTVSLEIPEEKAESFNKAKFTLLLCLFVVVIAMVFNAIPTVFGGVLVVLILLISKQHKAITMVDYGLLGTFICFFIFSGNLASISAVQETLSAVLAQGAFIPALVTSQIISNVPSAILIAPFTTDWQGLLLGVDIGGVGTLVASLASLITLAQYRAYTTGTTKEFLVEFTKYNAAFIVILVVVCLLF